MICISLRINATDDLEGKVTSGFLDHDLLLDGDTNQTLIFKEFLSIFHISENGCKSAILEKFKILKQRASSQGTIEYHI